VLSGVLAAGVLVVPELCWGSDGRASAPATAAVEPVSWSLREGLSRPPVRVVDLAGVLAGVDAAASTARADVDGVVVDAYGRTLVQTPGADRPVYSASLVKLLVVQQVLARPGPTGWDATTLRRLERAVRLSDDAAMNALWSTFDGPALIRDAVTAFGLTGTAPPADPSQWGETTTTAVDVARFLSALAGDRGADAARLLGWMRAATPVAADGFDQAFGLLSDAVGAGAAVKQGWMCCIDGRRQLHSAGVLADGRVVVLLSEVSSSTGWRTAARTVDAATLALVAGTG
jgi:hypothetical protein